MKAEHRKELETNTLADRMGQMMQRAKTGNRSTVLIYLLVAAALAVGAWFAYVTYVSGKQETSDDWLKLDDGSQKNLAELAGKKGDTPAGKAARLQLAWFFYWDFGVKRIGIDPAKGLLAIDEAGDMYSKLAKDCVEDPLFRPQALLGVAIVQESKAYHDKQFLEKAIDAYKEVLKNDKDTAEGKFAQARIDKLTDKDSRAEIERIYSEIPVEVRALLRDRGLPPLPPNHPVFGEKK